MANQITLPVKAGLRLTKNLNLWKEERPKVTQAVSDAAALGDRSETQNILR